ncbi:MAG: hypothetical protein R3230_01485 [Nitrosopumilaceae archaeon]|nr:hypothetical protein [Nitrosopumilaceae archaeon]
MAIEILETFDEEIAQSPRKEGYFGSGVRNIVRAGARGAEAFLGVPGSIAAIPSTTEQLSPERHQQIMQLLPSGLRNQYAMQHLRQPVASLPTAEQVQQKITEPLAELITGSKEYVRPQSDAEKILDDFASDIGALMFPLGGSVKLGKAAAISGAGNLAKWGSQKIGLGPGGQEAVKLGTMLLTSMKLDKPLKKRAAEFYDKAAELAQGERIPTKFLEKPVEKVGDFVYRGTENAPGKKELRQLLKDLNTRVRDGAISLEELLPIKREMNDYFLKINKSSKAGKVLTEFNKDLNRVLKKEIPNKAFSQALNAGDEIYSGIKKAERTTSYLTDKIGKNKFLSGSLFGALITGTPGSALKKIGVAATGAGVGYGGAQVYNIGRNILTNPSIRKEYIQIMKAASKQNLPAVIKNVRQFDKKAQQLVQPSNKIEVLEYF